MIVRAAITAKQVYEFVAVVHDDEVVGAVIGLLSTGADGTETGRVGTATGALLDVGTVGDVTGASTGASVTAVGVVSGVGAGTGVPTGPSVATNVHVSGQLFMTKHSHGNGNVINSSPSW